MAWKKGERGRNNVNGLEIGEKGRQYEVTSKQCLCLNSPYDKAVAGPLGHRPNPMTGYKVTEHYNINYTYIYYFPCAAFYTSLL
jgi:hypothetical protein